MKPVGQLNFSFSPNFLLLRVRFGHRIWEHDESATHNGIYSNACHYSRLEFPLLEGRWQSCLITRANHAYERNHENPVQCLERGTIDHRPRNENETSSDRDRSGGSLVTIQTMWSSSHTQRKKKRTKEGRARGSRGDRWQSRAFRRLPRLKLGPEQSNARVGADEREAAESTKGRKKEEPIRRMKRRLGRWKECRRTSAGGQPREVSLSLPERFSLHPLPSR